MDRSDIARMNDLDIEHTMNRGPFAAQWGALCREAGRDAPRVLQLACRVAPSTVIGQMAELEAKQAEVGAGFLGMLPDQVPNDLVVPNDLETSLALAIQLAQVRAANQKALTETMPQYVLSFRGDPFADLSNAAVPDGWELAVDVTGIRAVLDYFSADNPSWDAALQIAQMPAFQEMMKHRRELGYVPEPLIDTQGLAWCLYHAASRAPADELWKWLHPQNLFDLSDLYTYRIAYRTFIDQLEENGTLAEAILGQIARYAPHNIVFRDQLSFAVGWGIRGWATTTTGGVNIEHLKDHYSELLPTLIHETFHRLQTHIALPDPGCDELGFERVTSYPFPEQADRHLYQALCYIMLEGSATYVASTAPAASWIQDAVEGLDILRRIEDLDASQEEDSCDSLISEGLRSNGPFYGFGALLSEALVRHDGDQALGEALHQGAPGFMMRGLSLLADAAPTPSTELLDRIGSLQQTIVGKSL